MGRTLNLTEARSQLPALVKEAAESSEPIIITTRNEPKALLIGYQAFQRQQQFQQQSAPYLLKSLIADADLLLETACENQFQPGQTEFYSFVLQFEKLMYKLWETAEVVSEPHALIASQLCDLSRIYLAGEDQPKPSQFAALAKIVNLLSCDTLTLQDAAEADRYLLANGINTMPPIHDDLASLYEETEEGDLEQQ